MAVPVPRRVHVPHVTRCALGVVAAVVAPPGYVCPWSYMGADVGVPVHGCNVHVRLDGYVCVTICTGNIGEWTRVCVRLGGRQYVWVPDSSFLPVKFTCPVTVRRSGVGGTGEVLRRQQVTLHCRDRTEERRTERETERKGRRGRRPHEDVDGEGKNLEGETKVERTTETDKHPGHQDKRQSFSRL